LRSDAVSQDVVGLIDFGDMVYAPIINDLAVTATTFHRPDKEDLDTVEICSLDFIARTLYRMRKFPCCGMP
jgi:hypothetical protein